MLCQKKGMNSFFEYNCKIVFQQSGCHKEIGVTSTSSITIEQSEDKNEVLKILSHCESKDTLELGVKEIERLCPKLNGLTTRKIEMWRVNEVTCPQSYMSRCNLCKCKH